MNCAPWLLFIPLIIQGLIMVFDEFYFHQKRGLPKWEVIGHPLDTLTVIAPLLYAFFCDFNDERANTYVVMSFFSCLFVVKDELIHKDICSTGEMLLHALLFVFHPLVFISIFLLWQAGEGLLFGFVIGFKKIVFGQLALTIAFLLYQVSYWGIFNDSRHKQRNIQRAGR